LWFAKTGNTQLVLVLLLSGRSVEVPILGKKGRDEEVAEEMEQKRRLRDRYMPIKV